jgi:tetratricopeptide (TPR) repeat protein
MFPAPSQDRGHSNYTVSVNGEIVHEAGSVVGNLTVELFDPVRHGAIARTMVAGDGQFQFSDVPPGAYMLRVLSMTGEVINEQFTDVREGFARVQINLQEQKDNKAGSGTVSVAQLMHRVPPKALKEFEAAHKAFVKKETDKALEHLEAAVKIDPDFVEAQTDLGKLYVQKHEPEKVLSAFQHVLKVNPRCDVAYSASSLAYFWMNKYQESEAAARRSVDINGANLTSSFILGMSLAAQSKDDQEAVEYLAKSSSAYPNAHIAAAQILAREGKLDSAQTELQKYLKTGHTEHADEVKGWLNSIKAAQATATIRP